MKKKIVSIFILLVALSIPLAYWQASKSVISERQPASLSEPSIIEWLRHLGSQENNTSSHFYQNIQIYKKLLHQLKKILQSNHREKLSSKIKMFSFIAQMRKGLLFHKAEVPMKIYSFLQNELANLEDNIAENSYWKAETRITLALNLLALLETK